MAILGTLYQGTRLTRKDPPNFEFNKLKAIHAAVSLLAVILTHSSLKFVSYPTQILAKSCKVLPVMLGGLFVKHHQYSKLQYVSVFFVTLGVVAFNLMSSKKGGTDTLIGLILLSVALLADGFSSYYTVVPMQENVRKEHSPDGLEIMEYCSIYGLVCIVPIFLATEWANPQNIAQLLIEEPAVINEILTFSFVQ